MIQADPLEMYSSVAELLTSMQEGLGSTPSNTKKSKQKYVDSAGLFLPKPDLRYN